MQTVRGTIFVVIAYGLMMVMGLILLVPALLSRKVALRSVQLYLRIGLVLLRVICGTRCRIRGTPPTGPCIVAAKHQSFLDIWLLTVSLPEPRFVMKRSLLYTPVLGIFARRMGCVPIDRQAGSKAIRSMERGFAQDIMHGQIVIYPQGTRVAPGDKREYKIGVLRLHERFGLPVELVATNAGCFWPRFGLWRAPGEAVLEFLGPVPPETDRGQIMREIEDRVESASDSLMERAGRTGHVHQS